MNNKCLKLPNEYVNVSDKSVTSIISGQVFTTNVSYSDPIPPTHINIVNLCIGAIFDIGANVGIIYKSAQGKSSLMWLMLQSSGSNMLSQAFDVESNSQQDYRSSNSYNYTGAI